MSENKGGFPNLDISNLVGAIKSVDTPIKLLGLTIIVTFIILVLVVLKIPAGSLQTGLMMLMSGVITLSALVAMAIVILDINKVKQSSTTVTTPPVLIDYGAFVSIPMDGANNQEWEDHRKRMQNLVAAIRRHCEVRVVFYAGDLYPTKGKWQTPDVALCENFQKLKASNKFIMIFPRKTSSSVLVEAGMALALGKDTVIFAKNPDELPFLLRRAANASRQNNLPRINVYKYNNFDDIIRTIEDDGSSLLR
jgi:hypothetical protein